MDNFSRFKNNFKQDLLILVVICLKHKSMSEKASRTMVRKLIEILENQDAYESLQQINKLCETYPEILDIFLKRGHEFDEVESRDKVNEINIYLKTNKFYKFLTEGGEN